eukprot:1249145-Amorphochlora_amoeboformis.AAC.2
MLFSSNFYGGEGSRRRKLVRLLRSCEYIAKVYLDMCRTCWPMPEGGSEDLERDSQTLREQL